MIAQRNIFDYLTDSNTVKKCRHCQRGKSCRPRGLCFPCYADRSIRVKYQPSGSKYARWMYGETLGVRGTGSLPPESTDAPPGSEEKIRIMQERARRGESLFHPEDLEDITRKGRATGCRISSAISEAAKAISAESDCEFSESL